jgi:hypothetical protein
MQALEGTAALDAAWERSAPALFLSVALTIQSGVGRSATRTH